MRLTIMTNERLQYFIHDDMDAFRLELAGSLNGDAAHSVYQAWRTALSTVGERALIADITFLTDADEGGRGLLHLWHRQGVRIKAATADSLALAESILGDPFPIAASTPGVGWFRRLTAAIRRRPVVAGAGIPAHAEGTRTASASRRNKSTEFTEVSDGRELESHVP
jgi:hypothetical protein